MQKVGILRAEWSGVVPTCRQSGLCTDEVQSGRPRLSRMYGGSDRTYPECQAGLEQLCPTVTLTYDCPDKHTGGITYAAIQIGRRGREVRIACSSGVVGVGGLGHMAVKSAHALGAHVVAFTTSLNKKDDAHRLGADEVVISRNSYEMQTDRRQLRFLSFTQWPPTTT